MKSTKTLKKNLNSSDKNLIEKIEQAFPVYGLGITHHRTHQGKKLNFKDNQFLRDIYFEESRDIVIQKSTQCGVSEYLLVYAIRHASNGKSIFYVLPTAELMNRFVQNRFDKSLVYCRYYQRLIKEATGESTSMRLKHLLNGVISFAGSNTPNAFIEFPADYIIIDELDRCDQDNILMAEERQGASEDPRSIKVSNPTIPGYGISELFSKSDKKYWNIKCPACNKYFKPDFFKNVIRHTDEQIWGVVDDKYDDENADSEPRIICNCGKPVDRRGKGAWIKEGTGRASGRQISKLFTSQTSMRDLIIKYDEATSNSTLLQRFHNSELGLPFLHEGSQIVLSDLDSCKRNYVMPRGLPEGFSVMGIDVGLVLNVIVGHIMDGAIRTVYIGTVNEIEDLITLISRYNVKLSVIDSMPEMRMAKKFTTIKKVAGLKTASLMCQYVRTSKENINIISRVVSMNRTVTLDRVKEWLVLEKILLPKDASTIKDFYPQMTSSVRVYDEKRNDYKWDEGAQADHYFHAMGYMLIAHKILTKIRK